MPQRYPSRPLGLLCCSSSDPARPRPSLQSLLPLPPSSLPLLPLQNPTHSGGNACMITTDCTDRRGGWYTYGLRKDWIGEPNQPAGPQPGAPAAPAQAGADRALSSAGDRHLVASCCTARAPGQGLSLPHHSPPLSASRLWPILAVTTRFRSVQLLYPATPSAARAVFRFSALGRLRLDLLWFAPCRSLCVWVVSSVWCVDQQ